MAETPLTPEHQHRQYALEGMTRFADKHGVTDRDWREIEHADRVVFIGKADDGREFALGYMKGRA